MIGPDGWRHLRPQAGPRTHGTRSTEEAHEKADIVDSGSGDAGRALQRGCAGAGTRRWLAWWWTRLVWTARGCLFRRPGVGYSFLLSLSGLLPLRVFPL